MHERGEPATQPALTRTPVIQRSTGPPRTAPCPRGVSDEGSFAGACHPEERKRRRICSCLSSAAHQKKAQSPVSRPPSRTHNDACHPEEHGAPADGSLSAGCKRRRIPRRSLSSRGAQATKDPSPEPVIQRSAATKDPSPEPVIQRSASDEGSAVVLHHSPHCHFSVR